MHPTTREASRLLIVAAHTPELQGLVALLGECLRAKVGSLFVEAKAIGIGLCAASRGVAKALSSESALPHAVILVGTCGAYHDHDLDLGSIVVARQVCLASAAVALGQGRLPAPMMANESCHAVLSEGLLLQGRARQVDVATTLAITSNDELAARLANHYACSVEHLEAFAVAQSCAQLGVPFAAVLGVANFVGEMAHFQWRENHLRVGALAAKSVASWLEVGAPGL